MTARMGFMALALATPLTGCATLTGASAPSCDGLARRPLNRSLWDWENAAPIKAPTPTQPPAIGEPLMRKGEIDRAHASKRMAALPLFDIAASTRRCGEADNG